jgi:hypothetical protein
MTSVGSEPRPPEKPPQSGSPFGQFRLVVVLAVGLVAMAVTVPLVIHGGGESKRPSAAATAPPRGRKATGNLLPVPTNHVTGVGEAVVRLSGIVATVSVTVTGLLDAPHAMGLYAGARRKCPPASAARSHRGHLAISWVDGLPWYGSPVTALTISGPTSPRSIVAFNRFPGVGSIRYSRRIRVGPLVAASIRQNKAVVVVHGIDYNHNGVYDFSALGRSDLKRSLAGEATAPALCGPLLTAPGQPGSGGKTKTGHVPRASGTEVYTASLRLERERLRDALAAQQTKPVPKRPSNVLKSIAPRHIDTRTYA